MNLSENYLLDLMVRMAHNSTAIEGNSLSLGDTKSILIDGYVPRPVSLRELNEVLNYKAFMPFLKLHYKDVLDLRLIKEIHAILCKEAIEGEAGEFKKINNLIIGADFTPTPPYMVQTALTDWLLNLYEQLKYADTKEAQIEAILRQHIAFEHIHPFSDGNGRVGRAIMALNSLYLDMPPIVIPVKRRNEYLNYLATEDLPGFLEFVLILQDKETERMELFDK